MQDDLKFLLGKTSHSDPVVLVHSLDDVNRVLSLLGRLGIPKRRLRIEVRSLPRGVVPAHWVEAIAQRTRLPTNSIVTRKGLHVLPKSIKAYKEGRLAVQVLGVGIGGSSEDNEYALAYGWRVGCYYALCALRSVSAEKPVQAGIKQKTSRPS